MYSWTAWTWGWRHYEPCKCR